MLHDWLIETNSFLTGEYILILSTGWMGERTTSCPSIISIKRVQKKKKKKETRIPTIASVNVPMPL